MKQNFCKAWMIVPGLLLASSGAQLRAQAPPSAQANQPAANQPASQPEQQAQPTPQLKVSPLKALQNFEPEANAEYELGAGDVITLNFPTRPELVGQRSGGGAGWTYNAAARGIYQSCR